MEYFLSVNQLYVFYLIGVMICTGIIKEHGLFMGICEFFYKHVKSKRLLVVVISACTGLLPIPGRVIVSASMLDTIATKNKKRREVFGLVDYLSTHHYYLWSPLEKTIILPMAAFGLTYRQMLGYTAVLLVAVLSYTMWYLTSVVKESDIDISFARCKLRSPWTSFPILLGIGAMIFDVPPWLVFSILTAFYMVYTKTYDWRKILGYINFKLVGGLILVVALAGFLEAHSSSILEYIHNYKEHHELCRIEYLTFISVIAWLTSFILGSSAKFTGLVIILTSIFGLPYLTYFMALEYSAYLLSPAHKCVIVAKEYFGTNIGDFIQIVGGLVLFVIIVGVFTIL